MDIILKYFSDFSDEQVQQFKELEGLYKEWNEKINVISRKDIDGLYEKHVLHSLSIAAAFDFPDGSEIIDIGTGGGFPGIPLAIFFPEVKFHLADSIAKKLKVVDAVAKGIHLKNITTQHTRAEEIKGKKFDFAVSRAVAPLKDLWKWSKPLLRQKRQDTRNKNQLSTTEEEPNSKHAPGLICLKGGDLAAEIHESGTRPRVMEVKELFPEEFFTEKYLLYVPR
ncbi:MAG TPA: 16S rRNA (guanine(527)-N(7))-methyltransferase RsmG [Chitinophagaceae bacterium]|nr:16S rRNA (guanine(527)-N(7))-methyltransferase RsmG [Chitinophagaceae bacterium]